MINYKNIILLPSLFLSHLALAAEESTKLAKPMDMTSNLIDVVIGLAIILTLFFFLSLLFKKANSMKYRKNKNMSVVGGLILGQKEKIVMIEVEGEKILLGVSPGRINKIHLFENSKSAIGHSE